MANIDKLLGVRIGNERTERIWGGYRLDLEEEADLDPDDYDGEVKVISDNKYHSPKEGYVQKVLVEYEETSAGERITDTLDAVKKDLDEAGIEYVEEDVYPTQSERNDIEDYGATNGVEVENALAWGEALDDLETGAIGIEDFQRGRNPNKGKKFSRPKNNPGRGHQ